MSPNFSISLTTHGIFCIIIISSSSSNSIAILVNVKLYVMVLISISPVTNTVDYFFPVLIRDLHVFFRDYLNHLPIFKTVFSFLHW